LRPDQANLWTLSQNKIQAKWLERGSSGRAPGFNPSTTKKKKKKKKKRTKKKTLKEVVSVNSWNSTECPVHELFFQ
jgi:hypothetical protein